jgi:hypothetical protein
MSTSTPIRGSFIAIRITPTSITVTRIEPGRTRHLSVGR